ncbi:ADP-ribosylglycohydrolase family protein [Thiohalomonas denitrificans]|uniref:ADP-ribosylglycohydrolase family protein n=1 Tax=Thiohalomonas denitrificans TaxID=415747 RepID=UPI0026EC88F1|nr:ADP-ribosylglycohydrolase family protein [Thiohalomonas denitrificans]
MIGAIAGDVIGSVFEGSPIKSSDFPLFSSGSRFTDDSVLSVATAEVLMHEGDYAEAYRRWFRKYPDAGYGRGFRQWAATPGAPAYDSFGNGSAMRVAPVGWACSELESVYREARRSAAVSHNHPEGIKGAQAIAVAVFLARQGENKSVIHHHLEKVFGYDLKRSLADIRPDYRFDATCLGSVPEAMIAFLEADDFESAVRGAISLGGDADTQACMAGAVAEAYYGGVPADIRVAALTRLDTELLDVVEGLAARFRVPVVRG